MLVPMLNAARLLATELKARGPKAAGGDPLFESGAQVPGCTFSGALRGCVAAALSGQCQSAADCL